MVQQKMVKILRSAAGQTKDITDTGIRVAAYCRVSTDKESQQSSLETQVNSFRELISTHPGWTLADVYIDDGVSGTRADKRPGFCRMIADCEEKKIDYIVTKSISRFARNTIDCLHYVRYLKELDVYILFDENNLDTANSTSEMLLSILAAVAQEESHSISENMKWGVRKRFAAGIPKWSPTYGYNNREGKLAINEDQAVGVRRIFDLCIQGKSLPEIVRTLEAEHIPTMEGKRWWPKSVAEILRNEKYIGDIVMQKTYVIDHIAHKKVKNDRTTVPGYHISDHHKGIIDRHTFETAQLILTMKDTSQGCVQYPYYGTLLCPVCGKPMVCVRLPTRGYPRAWTCGGNKEIIVDMGIQENASENSTPTSHDCPYYTIKMTYIDKAIKTAFTALDWDAVTEQSKKNGSRGRAALAALKWRGDGLNNIEYIFLDELVEAISFKTGVSGVNWRKLEIRWKFGITTATDINYSGIADIPYIDTENTDANTIRHNKSIENCCLTVRAQSGRPRPYEGRKKLEDTQDCG